jgi:HSP20 family molecular chaperone IbpA
MIKCRTRRWYQVMVQWYDALWQGGMRCWPRRQVETTGEQGWLSSRIISGGPVHAVEETEAEVIIITTFPRLASTEVTMELAGDRLLIQGTSPGALLEPRMDASHTEGSHDVLIRSTVLPCAVDLTRASVTRQNGMVRITLPKEARGPLHQVSEKRPGS